MEHDYVDPATRLNSYDAPAGERLDGSESLREHYRRLGIWNREDRSGKWVDERRATMKDRKATLDAIAGQLELTGPQREKAWDVLRELPDRMHQGTPTSLLCLCAAAFAGIEDGRDYHPNHSHRDTRFDFVRRDIGYEHNYFATVFHRIQEVADP